nr:hypothetical protein CFP56_50070 [Quercus suber]
MGGKYNCQKLEKVGVIFSTLASHCVVTRTRTRTLELFLYNLSRLLFSGPWSLKTLLGFAAHPFIFQCIGSSWKQ